MSDNKPMRFGYFWEIFHKESGEVVHTGFSRDAAPFDGEYESKPEGFWIRYISFYTAAQAPIHAVHAELEITQAVLERSFEFALSGIALGDAAAAAQRSIDALNKERVVTHEQMNTPIGAAPSAIPAIGEDPLKSGNTSLEACMDRLKAAYVLQQPLPVPNQMALVWRYDIGRMRADWLRLNAWQKMEKGSDVSAIPAGDQALRVFLKDCAAADGIMVDGDSLSASAKRLLAVLPGSDAVHAATDDLPLLRAAFRVTESEGHPDPSKRRFMMQFSFGSMVDMHMADAEWCAFLSTKATPDAAGENHD